jgi:DNA-binding response OmpR family regulator
MFTEEVRDGQAAERRESALIWVVDRDSDLLRFLKTSLVRSMGSEVRLLQCGDEALGAFARSRPDVLLCELDLPGVTGEELASAAAHLPRPPSTVLMSKDVARLERARLLADRLLPKPFPLNELVWSVGTLLLKGARA